MTKNIKIKYNSLLINEIQATYSKVQDFLFWCPGGASGVTPDDGNAGGGFRAAKPNSMNGAFITAFINEKNLLWEEFRILPTVDGDPSQWVPSWFTAVSYCPDTDVYIDSGSSPVCLAGRMIAATGNQIFLQDTLSPDQWSVAANIVDNAGEPVLMDPCFIKVSPNGEKIALGVGYGQPLVIINTSSLSINSPLVINVDNESAGVFLFSAIDMYYDAVWYDNQYLIIDGGDWPGETEPPYTPEYYSSGAGIVDTEYAGDRSSYYSSSLLEKDGASAGIAIDSDKNLYCGVGFGANTGEIRILKGVDYDPATPPAASIDYSDLIILKTGDGVLSSAWLGVDAWGNITVGGGNIYDNFPDPPALTDYGFAALIDKSVVVDLIVETRTIPVDYITGEWKVYKYGVDGEKDLDLCCNDSATGIFCGGLGAARVVMYNKVTEDPNCAIVDNWNTGVFPLLKIYYPNGTPDNNENGIPDFAE